jgi:hypothetical protein
VAKTTTASCGRNLTNAILDLFEKISDSNDSEFGSSSNVKAKVAHLQQMKLFPPLLFEKWPTQTMFCQMDLQL